jgi:hypothetical protein
VQAPDEGERNGMRWFRSNIRFGSRWALFALALQIVLTYAHIDLCCLIPGLTKSAPALAADRSTPPLPNSYDPTNKSDKSGDSGCPICALIQLANTSAPAVAPILPVPARFVIVRPQLSNESEWAGSPRYPFQARAPPAI